MDLGFDYEELDVRYSIDSLLDVIVNPRGALCELGTKLLEDITSYRSSSVGSLHVGIILFDV